MIYSEAIKQLTVWLHACVFGVQLLFACVACVREYELGKKENDSDNGSAKYSISPRINKAPSIVVDVRHFGVCVLVLRSSWTSFSAWISSS